MQKKGNGLGVFFYEDDQVHNVSRGGRGEIINLSFTSFGRKDVSVGQRLSLISCNFYLKIFDFDSPNSLVFYQGEVK